MTASRPSRLRAYAEFLAAVLYFFLAREVSRHFIQSIANEQNEQWTPLLEQAILVFFLIVGYAGMGLAFDRQSKPFSTQGLPRRPGWSREIALGLAAGWAITLVCVLPLTIAGGIAIRLSLAPSSWVWLAADTAFFALAALAEEVAFRGYGFQRFVVAVGPLGATLGFAAFYAVVQALLPGSSHSSVAVSIALSLVLSSAYLRTRALWLSWGLNFAWKAIRALLFGLAIGGVNSHSPVVEGDPMGPFWVTGGGYGIDGSYITFFILLAAIPVIFRITRDLDFRYNAPEIVPAGIPVDLDAAARRQHEAAMGPAEPAAPALVQILPVATQPVPPESIKANPDTETNGGI